MTLNVGSFGTKNIVLDFLDRANREIYRLYTNYLDTEHVSSLVEAINVAAFLCGEFCVTPPGPVAECDLAREALLRREDYLSQRLIRFPLREKTIDEFIFKKRRTYGPHRSAFAGLFGTSSVEFFKKFAVAFTPRKAEIGASLAKRLEEGPDIDEIWKPLLRQLNSRQIENIRIIGQKLLQNGSALTWRALCDHLPDNGTNLELLRIALQHYYFSLYKQEYDAVVLTGVPFATVDLRLSDESLCFDYRALESVLRAGRLWNTVRRASAESMLTIRAGNGHRRFRLAFQQTCQDFNTLKDLRAKTSVLSQKVPATKTAILGNHDKPSLSPRGFLLSHGELAAVDECLALLADGLGLESPAQPALIQAPSTSIIIIDNSVKITGDNMHIGDKFENISQSIIAARQGIATGVIQLSNSGKAELAGALQQVADAISKAPAQELTENQKKEAFELLSELTKQAALPSGLAPTVAKTLGNGLWDNIKNAASVVTIVKGIWPIIESLWK